MEKRWKYGSLIATVFGVNGNGRASFAAICVAKMATENGRCAHDALQIVFTNITKYYSTYKLRRSHEKPWEGPLV